MILKTYCGYIKDNEKVLKSASGGLATALSEKMITNDSVVYGVTYASNYVNAEYIRIDRAEEIHLIKGSKYIKASLNREILESLADDLKSGKSVLFTGLPCDISVVKSYLDKYNIEQEKLFCVDLICYGPTSSEVAKEYIEFLEKKYKSKISEFSTRYKNPFWSPSYLYAKFENGKEYIRKFSETEYGLAFSLMPARKSCHTCPNKGEMYKSDITIGDYWGIQPEDNGYNKYGTSVAFVHTEKGDALISSLDNFCLFEADLEKALKGNPRYVTPVNPTSEAERFRERFEKKGLFYAASKHYGIKKYIPPVIRKIAHKIVHIAKHLQSTRNS